MISIVGGGPVGNYLAYLLAKKRNVQVFEEHDKIGVPVQCTGIMTSDLAKLVPLRKKFLVNKIGKVIVHSPNNKVEIKLKKKNIVVDRRKFDEYLYDKAIYAGAKYNFGWKFKGLSKKGFVFNKGIKKGKILIGADGSKSIVAKNIGLENKRFVVGLQARASLNCNKNVFSVYLDKGMFGWCVPENNDVARVGVIAKNNQNYHFKKLLKRFGKFKIREYQSGIIPVFENKRTSKGSVFLVGDSAGHVKATTYGGIVPGLKAAQELTKAILLGKNYERLWRKRIGRDLKYGLKIRNKLNKFSGKDYDKLLNLVKQRKIKNLIGRYDRERAFGLGLKLVWKEPRFLKFL